MELPNFITHYYEADYGPFLNICDLGKEETDQLVLAEKNAKTAFNRFSMGPDFLRWTQEADDLLIRAYTEKFGHPPEGRPYFALLGSFDKTLTMFREGRSLALDAADFQDHELTFMYPDHAHLIPFYGSEVPSLFFQRPPDWDRHQFWGRLFTYPELLNEYAEMGIGDKIEAHKSKDGWAGCYVEAHLWRRGLRDDWSPSTEY